jgi:hypothetical protein
MTYAIANHLAKEKLQSEDISKCLETAKGIADQLTLNLPLTESSHALVTLLNQLVKLVSIISRITTIPLGMMPARPASGMVRGLSFLGFLGM